MLQRTIQTHLLFLVALLLSVSARASEHLEPEDSAYSGAYFPDYTDLILEYLASAYAENVILRVIGTPSFSPEFAVGIKKVDDSYFIFYDAATRLLWEYQLLVEMDNRELTPTSDPGDATENANLAELKKKLPQHPMNIPRKTCEREIPPVLMRDIAYVWREMLYDTRYRRNRSHGRDGETYHFSAPLEAGTLAGKVWSPEPSSRTGKLVAITHNMVDYCMDKGSEATKLINNVRELHSELLTSHSSASYARPAPPHAFKELRSFP